MKRAEEGLNIFTPSGYIEIQERNAEYKNRLDAYFFPS